MPWARTSRQSRGYGAAWDRLRLRVLKRDSYMCQCDECRGLGKVATEVNHIKRKVDGGDDDPSNLQAINRDCHKRVTALQAGGVLKEKVKIGLDGFPVD